MDHIIQWLEENSRVSHSTGEFTVGNVATSMSELQTMSVNYAAELHRLGVKSGDKIGVFFDNGSSYLGMLLAVWRLNAVVVPLSPKSLQQIRYAEEHGLASSGCLFKLLIHNDATSEDVLIQWMRLCDGAAYSMDHFNNPAQAAPTYVAMNLWKTARVEDVAVYKIPQRSVSYQGNIDPGDCMLTHGQLFHYLQLSECDCAKTVPSNVSKVIADLLALVTLPLVGSMPSSTTERYCFCVG
jgi:acyl-CoA synthetase (AMP-forming)/AMP-acid ligase II